MSDKEINLVKGSHRRIFSPESKLSRQVLAFTDNLMLVRHHMEKGWVGTRHSHPHEQLVYIVHGHLQFTGGDKTFDAREGDSFIVPGGVEHQASAVEASEVLDVFTPYRQDYAENI